MILLSLLLVIGCGTEAATTSGSPSAGDGSSPGDLIDLSQVTIDPNNPVTIEYWHYFTDNRGGPTIRKWIDEFQAEHPGITVVSKYNETDQIMSNVQTALAAGTPPDVVVASRKRYLVDDLGVLTMDQFAIDDSFWADYYPNVLEFGQLDGRQVSVPYAFSTSLLYYNADLFRAAGLDPDRPPTTMAELRDAARQIKERTGKWGLTLLPSSDWTIRLPFVVNDAEFIDAAGEAAFASPAGEEAMQLFADMRLQDQSLAHGSRQEMDQGFLSGNIGMAIITSASINFFQSSAQFDLRAAPIPAFDGVPLQAPNGGSNLMILTQDPQKQKAAWEWIQFISAPERLAEWTAVTGYLPPKEGVLESGMLDTFVDENPLFQQAIDMLPYTVELPEWPGANAPEISKRFVDYWDGVMAGNVDPVEGLHALQDEVNGLLP